VITGGEPTLRKGLVDFIRKVRTMGFKVKLDTNGSNPQVLRVLLSEKLVDYVAMDVKTDPYLYAPSLWGKNDPETILSSISVIMDSNCRYEFRTTCVRPFVDEGIITRIGEWINGAEKYVLQPYSSAKTLDPDFTHRENAAYSEKELQKFKALADSFVGECVIR
jgi:pyruvate formate lyase activating enzyme